MTDPTTPFPLGFPLHEFPDLTEEVLFAYHLQIGKFIYLNAAFEHVWQLERTNFVSGASRLIDTVHPDDRALVADSFAALQREKQKQAVEFRIQPHSGGQKWIRLNAYVSQKGNTEVIVGIATNITAEKDYSETIHEINDKKNSVLQILSHDLLGPLGNIQLSAEMLSEDKRLTGDETLSKLLNAISYSSRRSVEMIQDLINSEFLQTSETAFVKQRVDLAEQLRVMVTPYLQAPATIRQHFRFTSSAESLYVGIDESKFIQAINNLVSNALKFTPKDGSIEVSLSEPDDEHILITVKDTGIGIPAAVQPFLFDKFTKARRTGLHGEPTHGLGMSIIKTIVEWHDGRIWFESAEGKGTTFFVEIPKDR